MEAREASLTRREDQLRTVIEAVKALISALSQRVLTLMALTAGIAAFGFTIFDPTPIRIAAAVLYATLVFLPLAVIDARR